MNWAAATSWKTREDIRYSAGILSRVPAAMKKPLAQKYLARYERDHVNANRQLLELNELIDSLSLDNQPLRDHFDEDKLLQIAHQKADIVKRLTAGKNDEAAAKTITDYCRNMGLIIRTKHTSKGLRLRAIDPDWWRRQLRKLTARSLEEIAIKSGLVHRGAGIYCSDFALASYRAMKARNRSLLEQIIMSNENGDEFSLQELSDRTTANPAVRRAELMTRIRGFEEYAKSIRFAAVFITITAPSHYHARSYRFSGATPRDTQRYLNQVWARIRAAAHRRNISLFGFRVAEPHHDGTPHFHALLFTEPHNQAELVRITNKYALAECGDEKGAKLHRVKVEFIDYKKGSATSYIAKYISKNIDGYGVGQDLEGFDAISSAERISAWASVWGIRQFQQIGGVPVTVWRTLRKLDTEFENSDAERARVAADNGEWDLFLRHSMAAGLELFKQSSWEQINHQTGEIETVREAVNKYGEPVSNHVIGIRAASGEIRCLVFHFWEARLARPWTGVNNCTEYEKIPISAASPPQLLH
jgi:hypothetical protein